MFTDGTYAICWIRVSSSSPLRAGHEAVALGRDQRLAEATAYGERFAAEHRGGARKTARLCWRWWNARPGKLTFYPDVIDSLI